MKRLIAFDLDGTLAESKQPIDEGTANLLAELLDLVGVAVISGGDWPQFETQVVSRLPSRANLRQLFIMPTTGTKLYRYEGTESGLCRCVRSRRAQAHSARARIGPGGGGPT